MLNINYELLANVKEFKLLTPRQSSYYQLRVTVYHNPTMKNKVLLSLIIRYVSVYGEKPEQLIPYLILTPQNNRTKPSVGENELFVQSEVNIQISSQNLEESPSHSRPRQQMECSIKQSSGNYGQSFDRSSSLDVENNTNRNIPQMGQIDMETNAYWTKPFLLQRADQSVDIGEVVVFKGNLALSIGEICEAIQKSSHNQNSLLSKQHDKKQQQSSKLLSHLAKQPSSSLSHILSSLYVSCELFLVNSYSTESIGEWAGYTLAEQGNVVLPVAFFAYNASYATLEMAFLWTSIDYVHQKYVNNQQLSKVMDFIQKQYQHLANNVLALPTEYSNKHSSFNGKLSIKQDNSVLQNVLSIVSQYNEKTHQLWKRYQEYLQETILSKGKLRVINNAKTQQRLKNYEENLKMYHWKNHVLISQDKNVGNKLEKDNKSSENEKTKHFEAMVQKLSKIKCDPLIDHRLVFYPFARHQRSVKLSMEDLCKSSEISSIYNAQLKPSSSKVHLLIFVHGYQASNYDMQNLACFLKYKQPKRIRTFVSSCNEGRTQQPIEESGHRLAIEIKNFINNKFEGDRQQMEISFVCHSMGGLIVRAALKYLQLYKSKFRTYLSLCSPHLGYLYHSSALIKTSLWVLNQVKKDPSMIELSMQDNSVLEKTYLYELSKKPELQWFRYPIFVGSREDQYVPFWSALVQDKQFYFETKDAKIYKQLYKNLTENIEHKIIRLETTYQDKINDISSFVGRTAHIRILNCIEVMEIIYLLVEGAF